MSSDPETPRQRLSMDVIIDLTNQVVAADARAESAEQQLTVARAELSTLRERHTFQITENHKLCDLATSARASVLAQVKALIEPLSMDVSDSSGGNWSVVPVSILTAKLDALQPDPDLKAMCSCGTTLVCPDIGCDKHKALPDPSLAVLSEADREQALTKAYNAATAEHVDGFEEIGASEMAEARSLLHLPQEPK